MLSVRSFTFAAVTASLSLLALTSATHAAHAQNLNGQPVNVNRLFPDASTVSSNLGTSVVTPAGATFSDGFTNIRVTPNQVLFTFSTNNGFIPSTFNGFSIREVGPAPVTFTSVTLDPASNLAGFDASRISFDANNIFANFQGLTFTTGNNVTLNLGFAPAVNPVPEPSEWAVMGMTATTLGGLMVRARRRSKNSS